MFRLGGALSNQGAVRVSRMRRQIIPTMSCISCVLAAFSINAQMALLLSM